MRSEAEAQRWLQNSCNVSRETMERVEGFEALLRTENKRHNLVAGASLDHFWLRHVADSAQLLRFAPSPVAAWLDIGTGAGFPGLIVALLHRGSVTLVESRRLRADFLQRAAQLLGVEAEIVGSKLERVPERPFEVISARACAPLPQLIELGTAFSTTKTVWILPKGRNAKSELEALDPSWQGEFRLEPSLTDVQARIIVAQGVHRKAKRKRR